MKELNLLFFFGFLLFFFSCTSDSVNDSKNEKDAFIFYYFEGYAGEKGGLHMAHGNDLHTWYQLKDSVFAPEIGEWGVFHDPSVARTDDGIFHLVWTCGKSGFGYARSEDGITWGEEKFVVVADSSRDMLFANVWAPEFFYENDTMYIIWSSTLMEDYVPPKDSEKWWTSKWKHRFYYTATTDFENFSPVRPFWDPGYNAIDAVVHKSDSIYYLFFKDERKSGKNVLMAKGNKFTGPYTDTLNILYRLTEGAIPVETDSAFILYYDYYNEYNGYRYITTKDMQNWSDEIHPVKMDFDENVLRHGSIVRVTTHELDSIQAYIQP